MNARNIAVGATKRRSRAALWSGVLGSLLACSTSEVSGDGGTDGASDAPWIGPSQGAPCAVEGMTAAPVTPYSCGVGPARCTCRALHWDCACPCAIDLRTVGNCPECCMCNGGLATRCDGTTFVPKECHAACGQFLDWVCIDAMGTANARCPHDGGTDASDASDAAPE